MATSGIWREVEVQQVKNSEIAASGTENSITGTSRVDSYNRLFVQNFDTNSDITVRLDNDSTRDIFVGSNRGSVSIEPEFGTNFKQVVIINRNSGAVVAASTVIIRAAKAVRVG